MCNLVEVVFTDPFSVSPWRLSCLGRSLSDFLSTSLSLVLGRLLSHDVINYLFIMALQFNLIDIVADG